MQIFISEVCIYQTDSPFSHEPVPKCSSEFQKVW